jgi:tRNA/tmRNA/rRNA uracil-C5-methylase (TrmA/RlmC/RlmD family)
VGGSNTRNLFLSQSSKNDMSFLLPLKLFLQYNGEMAQKVYTHVSKCKNYKIKGEKTKIRTYPLPRCPNLPLKSARKHY